MSSENRIQWRDDPEKKLIKDTHPTRLVAQHAHELHALFTFVYIYKTLSMC